MDIFNGLFCAEGSYKQFKSFAMSSNEVVWWGTSHNDTVREEGAQSCPSELPAISHLKK